MQTYLHNRYIYQTDIFAMSASTIVSPAILTRSFYSSTRLSVFPKNHALFPVRRSFLSTLRGSSQDQQAIDVCVKESVTSPGKLGDCPFTQRVLLAFEEKRLPYEMKLVNLSEKPDWFLKINPVGKVPVAKFDEKWIADSDAIMQVVEEKFPDPSLTTPAEKTTVGAKIFPAFIGFLKSKDPNDGTEQALLDELKLFDDHIKENGPYINGEKVCGADLSLAPKLYHMEIALRNFKNWSVPNSLPNVQSYMKAIFSMNSFVNTKPLDEDVVAGWRPKVFA